MGRAVSTGLVGAAEAAVARLRSAKMLRDWLDCLLQKGNFLHQLIVTQAGARQISTNLSCVFCARLDVRKSLASGTTASG